MAYALASTWVAMEQSALDIEDLFKRHGAFVRRSIERFVGAGPHVDDLLQETFVVAFKKRSSFDPERAAVTTWLYGIAANICRRHGRSQRRWGFFFDRLERQEVAPTVLLQDEQLERQQAKDLVAAALAKLPEKQREVFALYELEELDGPAIAELLAVPIGTVWTRLHHARHAFDKVMRRQISKSERSLL